MKLRFSPYWVDRIPPSRRRTNLPRQRGDLETRVIVIGGGLTGCASACALAMARVPVVLLEAGHLGMGATAGWPGLVREDFDASFSSTVSAHGLRAARTLWQTMRRGSLEFPAILRRLRIKCDVLPQDFLHVAPPDTASARALRREYDARRGAGLDHRWLTGTVASRAAGLPSGGAIKTTGAAVDPYRACVGLARAAEERGAQVFERTEVRRIKPSRKLVEVITETGAIRAETVIVATGARLNDLRQLRRHLHPRDRYAVVTEPLPAPVRKQVGTRAAALRDMASPAHVVRWLRDDRVLMEGADQDPVPARALPPTLVQRTGQLMYELSLLYPPISGTMPAWAWSYRVDDTVDGLPYIGTHRNFPRHLFALGLGRHGAGAAWLAARILARHVTDQPAKGDDLFGFARILPAR